MKQKHLDRYCELQSKLQKNVNYLSSHSNYILQPKFRSNTTAENDNKREMK